MARLTVTVDLAGVKPWMGMARASIAILAALKALKPDSCVFCTPSLSATVANQGTPHKAGCPQVALQNSIRDILESGRSSSIDKPKPSGLRSKGRGKGGKKS